MSRVISKRGLRAMRNRWERDLERLKAAYPNVDWGASEPRIETIRNLATAIAQIDGIITSRASQERTGNE